MVLEIHVLPTPAGTASDTYAHVRAAIDLIAASGLRFEVGALGTTVEGPPDALWALARLVHERTLTAGADRVVTTIRIAESADGEVSMDHPLITAHRR